MKNSDRQQTEEFLSIINDQLKAFEQTLDYESLTKAKELILKAEKEGGRVHVTGIGKPGHVSGYAASLLSSTGTPAYELHGTEAVHGSSGQVVPGDVVIAISNSGESTELKATVTCLKKNKAHIIAVTGNRQSWLAKEAEASKEATVTKAEAKEEKKQERPSLKERLAQKKDVVAKNEANREPRQMNKDRGQALA